jgi:glucose/arabinose dehydrogenase
MRRPFPLLLGLLLATCDGGGGGPSTPPPVDAGPDALPPSPDAGPVDAGPDAPPLYDGPVGTGKFCDLPGSFRTSTDGITVVPGGSNSVDLSFLRLPVGFCAHYFGRVGNPRQLRFAPGGELFVASPSMGTTSSGGNGQNAIIVLPDDDKDGYADAPLTFLSKLPATQGLLFTATHFYYQNGTRIFRTPYKAGDRAPTAASEQVADITYFYSPLHWPKSLDQADDGTIYVANGGNQGDPCLPDHPAMGAIVKLDGPPGGTIVAKGFRNPIGVRCSRGHNACYAIELSRDYSAGFGGREKLVPIRQGDDWGFPCCATKDLPYPEFEGIDTCSTVAAESDGFLIGSTPFDLDFEKGKWPEPWKGRVYVPLHGTNDTWQGARLVAIATDPVTGEPLPGSDTDGGVSGGAMADFATGFEGQLHGRPTMVAFSADGRLFLSNDVNGDIVWIAPLDLE